MALAQALFYMLVFPGFAFLSSFGMIAEWVDRKLHAKMQNRVGPPMFQPLADFIKLVSKQDLMPELADKGMYKYAPVVALAAVVTAFMYIPIWGFKAPLGSFSGDVIVVLYLLTIPTVTFFVGGWYSRSVYSMLGAARTLMQMFAYEVPLFLSILGPALLAGPTGGHEFRQWCLADMAAYYPTFYSAHPVLAFFTIVLGFPISLLALLGKLEKVPFDIAEAETEIVAGSFTEYSGRLLGIFRLACGIEMIVGCALIAAVFLPFGLGLPPVAAFGLFVVKVLALVAVMSLLRTPFARFRIDQMINFCWRVVAPLAFVQLMVDLLIKGWLAR